MQKVSRRISYLIAILTILAVVPLVILAAASTWIWFKLPDLDSLTDYQLSMPMEVYTSDGFLISKVGEERRAAIRVEDVPIVLKQAILAAEDKHFFKHRGITLDGLSRMIQSDPVVYGHRPGTASITMQVGRYFCFGHKNVHLSPMMHRLYHILLALKIERRFNKVEIFEAYVNQIYLGRNARGFDAAARAYFNKPLSEISFGEATMLAGLPKGRFTPNKITTLAEAKRGQRYVLDRMLDGDCIDEATYQKTLEEPLQMVLDYDKCECPDEDHHSIQADHITEMVRQFVVEWYGKEAIREGLKVFTTINHDDQNTAYEALRLSVKHHSRRYDYRGPERYIALPDGELDKTTIDDALARALDSDRRLRDYGGLLLAVVVDVLPRDRKVIVYRDGVFLNITGKGLNFAAHLLKATAPKSRQLRRGALVYVRYCSENKIWKLSQVPEVDAALVSIDSRTGAVRALVGGFDFNRDRFNNVTQTRECESESQFDCPGSPWELAMAYARYANGGYQVQPFLVREIQDADGNTLARFDPQIAGENARRVIDARVAAIGNLIHHKNAQGSVDLRSPILSRKDIASVTGSAADHRSFWFCGYNPEVVTVSWIGFPQPVAKLQQGGERMDRTAAFPIWLRYMRVALADAPETPLFRSEDLDSVSPKALPVSDHSGLLPARRVHGNVH